MLAGGSVDPHYQLIASAEPSLPGPDAWPARLAHSATVGPVTRLEFALAESAAPINVELSRDAFRALALAPGGIAYLKPTRLRHFATAA